MYESSEECELEVSLKGWFGIIVSPISITNLTFLVGGALPDFLEDLSAEALVHLMLHLVVGDASLERRIGVVANCLAVLLVGLRGWFSSDKDDDDKDDVLGRLIPLVGDSFTRVPVRLGPSSLRSNDADDDDDERAEPSKALMPELWFLFISSGQQYNFAMQTFGVAPATSLLFGTPLAIALDNDSPCPFSTMEGIAATSGR